MAFAFQAAETPGRAWRNTCFHAWMWGIHSFGAPAASQNCATGKRFIAPEVYRSLLLEVL